jgi:hypothetical protein
MGGNFFYFFLTEFEIKFWCDDTRQNGTQHYTREALLSRKKFLLKIIIQRRNSITKIKKIPAWVLENVTCKFYYILKCSSYIFLNVQNRKTITNAALSITALDTAILSVANKPIMQSVIRQSVVAPNISILKFLGQLKPVAKLQVLML